LCGSAWGDYVTQRRAVSVKGESNKANRVQNQALCANQKLRKNSSRIGRGLEQKSSVSSVNHDPVLDFGGGREVLKLNAKKENINGTIERSRREEIEEKFEK